MNVLFTSWYCCIRVFKEGMGLLRNGHIVDFMQHEIRNGPSIRNKLPNLGFFGDLHEYQDRLRNYSGVDIVHVHNEPDSIVFLAKETMPDTPVVYDCHDLASINLRGPLDEEERAMEAADAYIFPSKGYMDLAIENWALPEDKPKTVVYPMCLSDMVVGSNLTRIPGICYQGGLIGSKFNHEDPATRMMHQHGVIYRDHTDLARYLSENNILFGLYGVYEEIAPEYTSLGALCFGIVSYDKLLAQLSRYDWGFVGNTSPHNALKYCMPNKLFEYVAAGTPVIVMNCDEAGKYVEDNNLGIWITDIEDIKKRYNEHRKFRKIVQQKRHEFLMEQEIQKVINLYNKL